MLLMSACSKEMMALLVVCEDLDEIRVGYAERLWHQRITIEFEHLTVHLTGKLDSFPAIHTGSTARATCRNER